MKVLSEWITVPLYVVTKLIFSEYGFWISLASSLNGGGSLWKPSTEVKALQGRLILGAGGKTPRQ